tara:strand:- start:562 stop:747 length:186 start_codon:yes stop_codon:yes gene_type:complete
MAILKLSTQGKKLIKLYEKMVSEGYDRQDGIKVKSTYNDFELKNLETSVKSTYHIVALEQF